MATYLVELYWPDVQEREVRRLDARVRQAVRLLAADGIVVQYLGTTLVLGDEACFLRFRSPTSANVAEVCERAEVIPSRITQAVEVGRDRPDGR